MLSRQILAWGQILKIVAATLTCCLFSMYFVKSIVWSSYLLFIFKYSFIILLQGPQRYLIFICKVKATSHLPPGNPYPLFVCFRYCSQLRLLMYIFTWK